MNSNRAIVHVGLVILFVILFTIAFNFRVIPVEPVFLSISTFLFTIFSGFFIARQGVRYSRIRELKATFDGKMSAIYRFSEHLGKEFQNKVAIIMSHHYEHILETKHWDHNLTHQTSTITDIHNLLDVMVKGREEFNIIEKNAVSRITFGLAGVQEQRKQLVALRGERIPVFQWVLVSLFGLILLTTVMLIPSEGFIFGSVLKGAFGISILSVIIILARLDALVLFEGIIGEHSAQDVMDITKGLM